MLFEKLFGCWPLALKKIKELSQEASSRPLKKLRMDLQEMARMVRFEIDLDFFSLNNRDFAHKTRHQQTDCSTLDALILS